MSSRQDLLTAAYAAFNSRDIDAVLALMHSDVDWPNAMEGSRVHGHAGVRDYWTHLWELMNPHVEPVRFEDAGSSNTVVDVHQVVRDLLGNILLDQWVQHIYTIDDGLITRMDIRHPETGQTPFALEPRDSREA